MQADSSFPLFVEYKETTQVIKEPNSPNMFHPQIQNRSKNMKRHMKVDEVLYNDALRRQTKPNEKLRSQLKSKQTPILNTSQKLLAFKLIKEVEKQFDAFFSNDQEHKFNYIQMSEFLHIMGFIDNSDNIYSAQFAQERALLDNIWFVLKGEKYYGINERNLLVFVLAICGIYAKIPPYVKFIPLGDRKNLNHAVELKMDYSQSIVKELESKEEIESEEAEDSDNENAKADYDHENEHEHDDDIAKQMNLPYQRQNVIIPQKKSIQTKWISNDNMYHPYKKNSQHSLETSNDMMKNNILNETNNKSRFGIIKLDATNDSSKFNNVSLNQMSINKSKNESNNKTKILNNNEDQFQYLENNKNAIPRILSKQCGGVWDDQENISFNKKEIDYISKLYHSFHIQKLATKNHSQKFLDLVNELSVTNPEILEKSRVLAETFRQRQMEKASKYFTDAKIKPPNGGKISHAELLIYSKKESSQRKKEEYQKSKDMELKECTFKPKVKEYKRGSQQVSPIKDPQLTDRQNSVYHLSEYKKGKRSITPLSSLGQKRAEELYARGMRNSANKKQTVKTTNDLDAEKNLSECTFSPMINRKFKGTQQNKNIRDYAKETQDNVNRMAEGRRQKEILLIATDVRLNNTSINSCNLASSTIINTANSGMKFCMGKSHNKSGFEVFSSKNMKPSQSNSNLNKSHLNVVQSKKDLIDEGNENTQKSHSPIRNNLTPNNSGPNKIFKELQKSADGIKNNYNSSPSKQSKSYDSKLKYYFI